LDNARKVKKAARQALLEAMTESETSARQKAFDTAAVRVKRLSNAVMGKNAYHQRQIKKAQYTQRKYIKAEKMARNAILNAHGVRATRIAETEFNVAKANAKREKAILSTLMSEEVDTNLGESDSTTQTVVAIPAARRKEQQLDLMKAAEDAENEFSPVVETFIKRPADPTLEESKPPANTKVTPAVDNAKGTGDVRDAQVLRKNPIVKKANEAIALAKRLKANSDELSFKSAAASARFQQSQGKGTHAVERETKKVQKDAMTIQKEVIDKGHLATKKAKESQESAIKEARNSLQKAQEATKMQEMALLKDQMINSQKTVAVDKNKNAQLNNQKSKEVDTKKNTKLEKAVRDTTAVAKADDKKVIRATFELSTVSGKDKTMHAAEALLAAKKREEKADADKAEAIQAQAIKIARDEVSESVRKVNTARSELEDMNAQKEKLMMVSKEAMLILAAKPTAPRTPEDDARLKKNKADADTMLQLAVQRVSVSMNELSQLEDKLAINRKVEKDTEAPRVPPKKQKQNPVDPESELRRRQDLLELEFASKLAEVKAKATRTLKEVSDMRTEAIRAGEEAKGFWARAQDLAASTLQTRELGEKDSIKKAIAKNLREGRKHRKILEAEINRLTLIIKQKRSLPTAM